jgi:hypothetical protein
MEEKEGCIKVMLKIGKHKTKTNYMFRSQENQSTNLGFKNKIYFYKSVQ